MAGKLAFKQLQLRVLQCLAWIVLLVIAVWTVAYPGHEPTAVLIVRAGIVLLLTYIIGYATEQSAAAYGMAVCVLVKGIMSMRIAGNLHFGASDVFADAVILSPNRVLPLLCAVFGGVHFSVGVTLWSAMEILGIFVAHVSPTLAAPGQPLFVTIRSSEFSLLAVEFYYIAVAVTCGCTLVHYYKIALNELGEALQARQRFITNMVRPRAGQLRDRSSRGASENGRAGEGAGGLLRPRTGRGASSGGRSAAWGLCAFDGVRHGLTPRACTAFSCRTTRFARRSLASWAWPT